MPVTPLDQVVLIPSFPIKHLAGATGAALDVEGPYVLFVCDPPRQDSSNAVIGPFWVNQTYLKDVSA